MFETFKTILVEEFRIDESAITMESELSADLGINSVELPELIELCEEKFDIAFEDDDLRTLITVGDVVQYLEAHK